MADVADAAGVSISTVSHVLNGTRKVSAASRSAVLLAVRRVGYEHHPTVRSLAAGGSWTVGLLLDFSFDASHQLLAAALEDEARQRGMHVLRMDMQDEFTAGTTPMVDLIARHVDGVVLAPAPGWRRHALHVLRRHRTPFVLVDRIDRGVAAPQVAADDAAGMTEVVGHLAASGRHRMALLHGERGLWTTTDRIRGFVRAHQEHALPLDPQLLVRGYPSAQGTESIVDSLMTRRPDIDAVVTTSDSMLAGALDAIDARGLRIPQEIAVASYADSDPQGARYRAVTAALYPREEIAARAIKALETRLEGRDTKLQHERPEPRFRHGTTCGCDAPAARGVFPGTIEHDLHHELTSLMASGHGRRGPVTARPTSKGPMTVTTTNTTVPDKHFPALHLRPRQGWVNDPNGIHRVGEEWRVFFQHNPTSPWHSRICWGYATSTDLVHWQEQPIALRPRPGKEDSLGCWSGVGYLDDGVPTLAYSAVTDGDGASTTVLARESAGGEGWAPVAVAAEMPNVPGLRAMRDPFLFDFAGRRYAIHGAGFDDGTPAVLLYDCADGDKWEYVGVLLDGRDPLAAVHAPADIWECPQLVRLGDQWVLVLSLWIEAETLMDHLTGVGYLVGDLEVKHGRLAFRPSAGGMFETGPDFYAPQLVVADDRVLAWGWSWEGAARSELDIETAGYNGSLTFPRELALVDQRLSTSPARELIALRRATVPLADLPDLTAFEVELSGTGTAQLVDRDTREAVVQLEVDTAGRLFVDGSLIEAFRAEDVSHTARSYPENGFELVLHGEISARAWRLGTEFNDGVPSSTALRPVVQSAAV